MILQIHSSALLLTVVESTFKMITGAHNITIIATSAVVMVILCWTFIFGNEEKMDVTFTTSKSSSSAALVVDYNTKLDDDVGRNMIEIVKDRGINLF